MFALVTQTRAREVLRDPTRVSRVLLTNQCTTFRCMQGSVLSTSPREIEVGDFRNFFKAPNIHTRDLLLCNINAK